MRLIRITCPALCFAALLLGCAQRAPRARGEAPPPAAPVAAPAPSPGAVAAGVAAGDVALGPEPMHGGRVLRVCADPDNLPFSNRRLEGFENKLAAIIARELGDTAVVYTWWPHRRGFVRSTLRAKECDILMGVPRGFDPVLDTKPYYRSTYYFVTRADRGFRIASLDDSVLRRLRIGVNVIGEDYTNPPPAHALGARGVVVAKGYGTFYDDVHRPQDIIDAVARGEIDVAIAWGPLAGYFAKRAPVPLSLTPLPDSVDSASGLPVAFDIALGVRRSDRAFRAQLDQVLERVRPEVARLLQEYNVPTLDRPVP